MTVIKKAKSLKVWFKGLIAASISAAASAVTVYVSDPTTFSDWNLLGRVIGVQALVAAAMYLKRSPVP